ncbi:hypothetical protein R6Q59_022184 [Mikania micrantha]
MRAGISVITTITHQPETLVHLVSLVRVSVTGMKSFDMNVKDYKLGSDYLLLLIDICLLE